MRRFLLAHPDRVDALVFMDTSAGAPPGVRHRAGRRRQRGGAQPVAWRALKQLSDELDLLGSEAYQRVLAERPGFREYADHKWRALSPVMWTTLMHEIVTQPDQLAELAAITCRRS